MTIGEKIGDAAAFLSAALEEHDENHGTPPGFTDDGLFAIIDLFVAALMDRVWRLQEKEGMDFPDRIAMVHSLGEEVRRIAKVYADVDTTALKDI
jgi:hypothetical protein